MLRLACTLSAALTSEPAALQWHAPPGCPGAADVQAALAVYRAGRPARPGVRARAVVTATSAGWSLDLRIDAPEGASTLSLQDPACAVLVDATALLLALHLDATRTPSPPAPAEPTSSPRPPLVTHARAFAGATSGMGPAIAASFGVAVGLGRGRVRGELALLEGLPRTRVDPEAPSVGVAVRGWAVDLRACWAPQVGRWQALLCGDAELGAQVATGEGAAALRTRRALWASLGLGAGLVGWISPRFGLWIDGRGHLALTRPQFGLTGLGLVYRAPPAGVRVLAGIEVRFARAARPLTSRRRGGD